MVWYTCQRNHLIRKGVDSAKCAVRSRHGSGAQNIVCVLLKGATIGMYVEPDVPNGVFYNEGSRTATGKGKSRFSIVTCRWKVHVDQRLVN